MNNTELENNWKKVTYFATGYGFVVSISYLFGYWSTFGINILEYIKVSDVFKISIYPVITSIGLSIAAMIFGGFIRHWSEEPKVKKSEKLKYLEKWTERIYKYQVLIFTCLLMCYALYKRDWFLFWPFFALFSSLLITNILTKYKAEIVIKLIPFPGFEGFILWILIAVPFLAFSHGKLQSLRLRKGDNCFYVNISTLNDKELFQDQKRLKYIGVGGDFMFFLSEDNEKLYILEHSKIPVLELYKSKSQTKTVL